MGTKKRVMRSGKKIAHPVSNKPRFNFIEETFVSARGVKTKIWTLPAAEMESVMNDSDSDSASDSDGEPYPNFGVGVNPHESVLSNCDRAQQKISVGRNLGFTRRCKLNLLRKRGQRLEHKLIKKPAPSVPRFNFIQDTFVSARGVKTKVWTLPPAEMDSVMNDSDSHSDSDSDGSHDLHLYPNFGIGTQPSNPATGEAGAAPSKEQKELLFRSIATLLQKNSLSQSADVLMQEAKIKEDGATPPDIEGFLIEFLKKGESNAERYAHEKKLNEVEYDIFSKYTDSEVSASTIEFMCDGFRICIDGMHEKTVAKDVVKFFKEASVEVEVAAAGVKLFKPKLNFRHKFERSGTVRFKNREDTKNANNMNGSFMKIKKKDCGSFVYISRLNNSMRVLCLSGFEGDVNDDAFVQEQLKGFSEKYRKLMIVHAIPVALYQVCFVLVRAISKKTRGFLQDLDGRNFTCNGLLIRVANLKPNVFEHLFGDFVKDKMC